MTSLGWILFRKKKTPGTSAKSSLLTLRLDETATIRLQRWIASREEALDLVQTHLTGFK